jgi:lysophosphatidate acyltransferase
MSRADVEDLTRDTRNLMLKELTSLTSEARGRPMKISAGDSTDGVVKASGAEPTITS